MLTATSRGLREKREASRVDRIKVNKEIRKNKEVTKSYKKQEIIIIIMLTNK